MNKTLKIVLLNKTILSNGVVGPEYTPMTMTVEELIQNLKVIKPTPRIAYAQHISKEITLEALEAMVKDDLVSADTAAAILEAEKIKEEQDKLDAANIKEEEQDKLEADRLAAENSEELKEETPVTTDVTVENTEEVPATEEVKTEILEDGTPVITGNQQQGNKKRR